MGFRPALEAAGKRRRELAEALAEVENAVARPRSSPDWRAGVAAALAELDDSFRAHCEEVEREGGLLDEIVEEAPRLENTVHEFHRQHERIAAEIERLRRLLEADPDPEEVRSGVASLVTTISRHRQAGSDLVWEAYMVDIGGW